MTQSPKPPGPRRSLFWPIAGTLLLTAVLGTLVQILIATAILGPLETREARSRAELIASNVTAEIQSYPHTPNPDELRSILVRHHSRLGRGEALVFRRANGVLVADPPLRLRLREDLDRLPPPGTGRSGTEPPRTEPPSGSRGRHEVLARRPVTRAGAEIGQLMVLRRLRGRRGFLDPNTMLLFFPVALLASAVAGVILLRLLVRRLRSMEALAARVAEGDLSVRIADTSGDEIGRLAERLDRMTERLDEARSRIEGTERQRRQLFADITHELATPLTSIRGYAETMLDSKVSLSNDERSRYVHAMLDEASRLDQLIRDLFELARLEANSSPPMLERLDWAALCRNTVERFAPRFRDAGLTLRWRGEGEAWIEADGRRMEQVLENLLVNALRYVPAGGAVEVSIAEPSPGRYALSVSDDGPGLSEGEIVRVFERFYRGSEVRPAQGARDIGGSGLGLAIVRQIVERHGGSVRAERLSPHGLTIRIELPASVASAETSPGLPSAQSR